MLQIEMQNHHQDLKRDFLKPAYNSLIQAPVRATEELGAEDGKGRGREALLEQSVLCSPS